MIKYVVHRTDGRTEFTTSEAAQAYFNSIANGVSIEQVDEVQPVTYPDKEVACWRMRAVMELAGLKQSIDALIAALPLPDRIIALNAWEYGNVVASGSPFVQGIKQALSLTDSQVHNFFIQAENLPA
jgi:hypothetical protein